MLQGRLRDALGRQGRVVGGCGGQWLRVGSLALVPRFQWAVTMVHAVVTAVDKEARRGKSRGKEWDGHRDKAALVAAKRGLVAFRSVALLDDDSFPASLKLTQTKGVVVTNAALAGGGAIFCALGLLRGVHVICVAWGSSEVKNPGFAIGVFVVAGPGGIRRGFVAARNLGSTARAPSSRVFPNHEVLAAKSATAWRP